MTKILYLFGPALVSERLATLPNIAAALRDPHEEGVQAEAFPSLRKTQREVFRILGRANVYEPLDLLLTELEAHLARGWSSPQLKASSSNEFASLVSELHAARHFLNRGFKITPTAGSPIAGAKPEFYAVHGSTEVGVEVFQPRDWQLIDGFARKATGLLLNADVPTDFYASITLRLEHDFNSEHRLLHPHPEVLEAGLGEAMPEFLAGLADKVAALGEPDDRLVVSRPDVNLELETTFESVAPSGEEPDRAIAYGYSVSAYSPEWIFGDILRRIRSKAGERQAGGPGEPRIRLLIVDLSTSPISAHLDDEIRRPRYDQLFDDIVRPCAPDDYDVIALCEPSWEHGLSPRFVAAGDTEHVGLLN